MDEVRIYRRAINEQEIAVLNSPIKNNSRNTVTGTQAFGQNTTAYNNTADGYQALFSNTPGFNNTATGSRTLYFNSTGNIILRVG